MKCLSCNGICHADGSGSDFDQENGWEVDGHEIGDLDRKETAEIGW
jgi:hypothetical protein